jgi:hypothetical protein
MTSDSTKPSRLTVWWVGLGVAAAVALAIAASARTDGAERIRSQLRALFHRAEKKADRTGQHVQDAAEVIGETAVDLAHGPDSLSE